MIDLPYSAQGILVLKAGVMYGVPALESTCAPLNRGGLSEESRQTI